MSNSELDISKLESPFNWANYPPLDEPADHFINSQSEKITTINEDTKFEWNRCVLSLILAYEVSNRQSDYARALTHLDWVEQHVRELGSAACSEQLFQAVRPVLEHVTPAMKARVLADSGRTKEAKEATKQAAMATGQGNKWHAALLGLKASMFNRYGPNGHRGALELATEAAKLDPTEAEWHFTIGKTMGRIRRTKTNDVTMNELEVVERANKMRQNGTYIVHLAQLYSEYSSFLFFNRKAGNPKQNFSNSEKYGAMAIEYFNQALALRPDCSSTMARVAHGMIRIRHKKLLNLKFVKSLLDRVVEIAPLNRLVYHDLGVYYDKYENNADKAIACLKKGFEHGNLRAFTYMIVLKWKNGRALEIIQELKGALNKFKESEDQAELLAYLGAAHIIILNDWTEGVQHCNQSLEIDPTAKSLKSFWGFSGRKTNLLDALISEVEKKVKQRDASESFTRFLDLVKPVRPTYISSSFYAWKSVQEEARSMKKRYN